MDQQILIGVDGGGTHCRARITTLDGHILGEATAGPSNIRLGLEQSFREINNAIESALHNADLAQNVPSRATVVLGLAGALIPEEIEEAYQYTAHFQHCHIDNDAAIACVGAHNGEDGAILITGTGSCGYLRLAGVDTKCGGWGFQLSDHGSGAQLGLKALRYSLLAHENIQPKSPLTERIMAQFAYKPEQLMAWASDAQPHQYAAFVPDILHAVEAQDAVAQQLFDGTVDEARLLVNHLAQLGAPRIALMGGLAAFIAPRLPPELQLLLTPPQNDALTGALIMAKQHYHSRVVKPSSST